VRKKRRATTLKISIWENGITQRELALKAGISEATISLMTNGKYNPDASQRSRIARVLKRPETELFEATE